MEKIVHSKLMSLEHYAKARPAFRLKAMQHKQNRRVPLGDNATLYFEDALTMQYQVQEVLRMERILEEEAITEELDVYNALVPDGTNWKATFMLEYTDVTVRQAALERLIGIENRVYVHVEGCDRLYAIADEDLERADETRTSSVHFLRFELSSGMMALVRKQGTWRLGVDHEHLQLEVTPDAQVCASLLADLTNTAGS